MLYEAGMLGEVVGLAVLEDEHAIVGEEVVGEAEVWYLGEVLQGIRRVGEDEVELDVAALYELEHIALDEVAAAVAQLLYALTNEAGVVAVFLHAHHLPASARQQFEAYAASAGKEVESGGAIEIDIAPHHIEDVLLGEVCRRASLKRMRHIEVPPLVYASDYAHDVLC